MLQREKQNQKGMNTLVSTVKNKADHQRVK